MQAPTPRSLLASLLIAGAVPFLLAGPGLRAQTVAQACVDPFAPPCIPAINARLAQIEDADPDPTARAEARIQRARFLALAGRPDEAAALVALIQPPPGQPAILRDTAALAVIAELGPATPTHGRRLLDMIEAPETYHQARALYIAVLASWVGFDAAAAELAATDRTGQPLGPIGLQTLVQAAVAANQTDAALQLIAEHAAQDDDLRGTLTYAVVMDLAQAGNLGQAIRALDSVPDGRWQAPATAGLAAAYARSGRTDLAERLFEEARAAMAAIPDAAIRGQVFPDFAQAAIDAGRVDLAVDAVQDVSSFPLDVAYAQTALLGALVRRAPEETWRPIAADAIARLDESPIEQTSLAPERDDAWGNLALTIATLGDIPLAIDLMGRIADKDRQRDLADGLLGFAVAAGQFDLLPRLLPGEADWNLHVQALIRVLSIGLTQDTDIHTQTMAEILRLVEGPDRVELSDQIITELALYDARTGNHGLAESRLSQLSDPELQAEARILNLGYAARSATDADLADYIALAEASVARVQDPAVRLSMMENLLRQLLSVRKDRAALALAADVSDVTARDTLLAGLAAELGPVDMAAAMTAVSRISIAEQRLYAERMALLRAFEAATYEP